jgi:Protein of unknown function (DUF2630)
MDDDSILRQVHDLIAREHELRAARESGTVSAEDETRELAEVEAQLDQCWDLLRQRRAKREYGEDADEAEARPESVVEKYWQ